MKKLIFKSTKEIILSKSLCVVLILVATITSMLFGGVLANADSDEYVPPVYNFPDTNGGRYIFGYYAPEWNGYHLAIDLMRPIDTPVYSILDGKVASCGYMQGFGDKNGPGGAAIIEHTNNYGDKFYALYGHITDLEITAGQTVKKGQIIGKVMNLINNYGVANSHLHFGINTKYASYSGYTSEGNPVGFVDPYLYLEHTCKETVTPHTYEWVIDWEPTVYGTGRKHEECSLCGQEGDYYVIGKLVDEHTHIYHINGKTCDICWETNPSYDKSKPSGIEINGCQISSSVGGQQGVGGMRVVYSVDDTIDGKAVVSSGLIYAIDELAQKDQMFIGNTDQEVYSFECTTKGEMPTTVSDSLSATSYAMTMKFVNQAALEYTVDYNVRAYAELEDGTYVYSNISQYRIYDIAEQVYTTGGMPTEAGHNYLFENILHKVNEAYIKVDYITHM